MKFVFIDPKKVEDAPDVVCDMRMIVGAFQVTEGEPVDDVLLAYTFDQPPHPGAPVQLPR